MGLVEVTSICQFLPSGLSMVVDVRLHVGIGEGLGLGCRDVRVGVEVVDEDKLDVLVRLLALIGPLTVGHQMPAIAHLDNLVGLRVPAAMRARSMRLGVVAGQRLG
jgi:hypothetical protein